MKDFTGFKADTPKHLSNHDKNGKENDKTKKAKSKDSGMDYMSKPLESWESLESMEEMSVQLFLEPWVDEHGNTPGPPVTPGTPGLPGVNTSVTSNDPVEKYSGSIEVNDDDGTTKIGMDWEAPEDTNGSTEVIMDPESDGDDVVGSDEDWYNPVV